MDISNYLSCNYNIDELKEKFNQTGKVVINNFLTDKFADYVLKTIKKLPGNSWFNCCGFGNTKIEKRIIPSNRKKQEMGMAMAKKTYNKDIFSYNFHRNMGFRKNEITTAERLLRTIFLSQHFMNFISEITGLNITKNNQLFLSKYRVGHYLSPHSDINNGRIAYVLGMTQNWKPQYGGILHFLDEKRENIIDSYVPKFNSIILFRVPEGGIPHFVSHVSIDNKNRYSITGWLE